MKTYKRLYPGPKNIYLQECLNGNYIGVNFDIDMNLKNHLPDNWKDFNKEFIPVWLKDHPDKSRVSAGLACGMLWSVAKGLNTGDIVLCPDGNGSYYVGEVDSDYYFAKETNLPHRRKVKWYPVKIDRSTMSPELQKSAGSSGTISDISQYAVEIENLIGGKKPPVIVAQDSTIEDPSVFALETHLEEFLVHNWKFTEMGKNYEIFEEEGELRGQQYPCDTGRIDILAVSKDKGEILVVELKKGRASDSVVGQIQRYMGYVKEELAEPDQEVKGIIIALEDDLRIRRALSVTTNIEFYRYKVNFQLFKA
ncbi:MAG TPA: endonuclease NucS domain-containing protein [Bacteroidales bacterium]|nr:endonuclease NucS domain-containing protein [Bacteroidales bacterium]